MMRLATCLILCTAICSIASGNVLFVGDPLPLADLVAGQSIAVGDKTFSDFTYLAGGDMPSSGSINVQGILDCDGNPGIRIQGPFVDLPGGNGSDALISFTVNVNDDSNMLINDAHLAGNLDVIGGGLALVTETFIPEFNNLDLSIFNNGVEEQLTDWIVFDRPVRTLPVQKDILLLADDGGVATAFSFVDQTFSQIPEPTTGLLVLCGMIGLAFARRKR